MKDFDVDIQNIGHPRLDVDYWQQKRDVKENTPIFDANVNATFTDLGGISIFKNE